MNLPALSLCFQRKVKRSITRRTAPSSAQVRFVFWTLKGKVERTIAFSEGGAKAVVPPRHYPFELVSLLRLRRTIFPIAFFALSIVNLALQTLNISVKGSL